uniref:Uncharacterized protein n=1 Tax=Ixodes ricinus TaxID=34613 RepID=A0A6B0UJN1_IXORI
MRRPPFSRPRLSGGGSASAQAPLSLAGLSSVAAREADELADAPWARSCSECHVRRHESSRRWRRSVPTRRRLSFSSRCMRLRPLWCGTTTGLALSSGSISLSMRYATGSNG